VTIVFLLEEASARDLLEGYLPRLLPDGVDVVYQVFEGKQDLERRLVRTLRAWRRPESRFVVMRDQDAADCRVVKARLVDLVQQSGRSDCLVRVACHELESWVLGDWSAVAEAFERPALKALADNHQYRDTDRLVRPLDYLRRHIPDYQKRDGARRVGPLLRLERSKSASFRSFSDGLNKLIERGRPFTTAADAPEPRHRPDPRRRRR
jgi:hypothetical protein